MTAPTRAELVERLISATRRADRAEATLRDLAAQEGDPSLGHVIAVLRARIAQLEDNIDRLTRRRFGPQESQR